MLRYPRASALVVTLLLLAGASGALLSSKEDSLLAAFYETVFGSPDLGPVDFETLSRRATSNDALACPPDLCRARSDFDPGVYPFSDEELRRRFAEFALSQPDVIPVYRGDAPGKPMQDRYVQRSRLMRFPDTIDVRFIALGEDSATLAIYSRSQIGRNDSGVNLARIRLWTGSVMVRGKGL